MKQQHTHRVGTCAALAAAIVLVGLCILATQLFGCRSLGLTPAATQPTTQPATPAARLKAIQQDLDDAWRIASDIHDITGAGDKQFKVIATAYPLAQDAINLASVAIDTGQPDALDLLDKAAKAARDFRARVPKKR